MKAVVVMDSLKGSLSSMEAGEAAKAGILAANPEATVIVKPLADGGEGTTEALVCGLNGRLKTIQVTGPIYEPVIAQYGIIDEVAVIEMAQAAGLPQVPTEKRNPLVTTTYGVGEMIKACVESGCKKFIIGIGGSATNDAGIGMLMALGYKFLDANGQEVVQLMRQMFYRDYHPVNLRLRVMSLTHCMENKERLIFMLRKRVQHLKSLKRWMTDYVILHV